MLNYAKKWFMEADAGGGSGGAGDGDNGGVFEDPSTEEASEALSQEGTEGAEGSDPKPTGGDGGTWTPEKIQELIANSARAGAQVAQAPREEPKQLSQEEINARLNVFTPTEEQLSHILEGGEAGLGALKAIIEGVVRQATTTAWYQTQYAQQLLEQEYGPLKAQMAEARAEKLRGEFFTKYPDLKGQNELLAAVKASLDNENAFEGLDRAKAFEKIAQRAQKILTGSGQGGGGKTMASLSRGSQHGSGTAQSRSGKASGTAEAIFG